MMRSIMPSNTLAALLLLSCFQVGAQAAVITTSTRGVIGTNAIDHLGLFGVAGADLAGLSFAATIRYDRTPLGNASLDPNMDMVNYSPWRPAVPLDVELVINGRTYAQRLDGLTHLFQYVRDGQGAFADQASLSAAAANATSRFGMALSLFTPEDTFLPGKPRLESIVSYTPRPGDYNFGQFSFSNPATAGPLGTTSFSTTLTYFGLNAQDAPVPEPSDTALFAIALAAGGVGLARARRKPAERHPV